jgi:hypothetical protein
VNKIGGDKVLPLIELLREGIFISPFMHMDESYLQVLKSEKAPTSTHYMVVRAAGPPGKRIILYDYVPSRTREALKQLLVRPEGPYRGKLLTDGLEHYDDICQELQLDLPRFRGQFSVFSDWGSLLRFPPEILHRQCSLTRRREKL